MKHLLIVTALTLNTPAFSAEGFNLQVTINQLKGTEIIETVKNITAKFNEDVIIEQLGFKNKIILKLQKFKNISVNGTKINPVQVDMTLINELKQIIGKPQTITSFYSQSADFRIASSGKISDRADLDVSLKFSEN